MSDALVDYIQALVRETRESPDIEIGLSPRGAQALAAAARHLHLFANTPAFIPDDVQAVFAAGRRLIVSRRPAALATEPRPNSASMFSIPWRYPS